MVIFMGLVMPMPFTVKRKLFTFVSESALVAKLQYGLKVHLHPMASAVYADCLSDHFHLYSHSLRG